MHTFILQDWITVRGSNNTVTQSESEWLDLTQYEDVMFWIDVREVTGTVTLNIQTSPTKDETFFTASTAAIYTSTITASASPITPSTTKVLMASASVPVARYLRWSLTSATAPFDATFRIITSANAPGI
jgi:hypothetical protein